MCLDLAGDIGVSILKTTRVIPPSIYNSIAKNLSDKHHLNVIFASSRSAVLRIDKRRPLHNGQHIKVMVIGKDSSVTIKTLDDFVKVETLLISEVDIPTKSEDFLASLGSALKTIKNLRFESVNSSDSVMHTDEIFIQLAHSHLSKNRELVNVDLRGSDIDLVADCSRRNLSINFGAELRRWARRLRGLAFETEINLCRVLRILNRQIPFLKSLCISPGRRQSVCEVFDNLKSISDSSHEFQNQTVEKLAKLHSLCLCRHFKVTDSILRIILPSLSALKYFNVAGCAVNFEQYWHHLPRTLEELIIDECDRSTLLKCNRSSIRQLLRNCPNLTIYVSPPTFQAEDLESLKGLALLNGASSILSDNFNNFPLPEDGLITFELRVKELQKCATCIKLF